MIGVPVLLPLLMTSTSRTVFLNPLRNVKGGYRVLHPLTRNKDSRSFGASGQALNAAMDLCSGQPNSGCSLLLLTTGKNRHVDAKHKSPVGR